jgi:hypothetical protein
MTDDKAELHSLRVTLSRMYRKSELARPRVGVYKLPAPVNGDVPLDPDEEHA